MNYKYYYDNNNVQDDYGLKHTDNQGYAYKCAKYKVEFPIQEQNNPPRMKYLMIPRSIFDNLNYKPSGKLTGKVAIITGGDSGLRR